MSTTFANTIDGNDIYAKRAECDAAGNTLSTTYATKGELPTVDQTYDGTSTNPQSGTAVAGALASYTPTASLATVATTGDFDDLTSKPTVKPLVAGSNITITENTNDITIAATGGGGGESYTAGTGIDITSDVISVDTSVVATQTDLAGLKQVPAVTSSDNGKVLKASYSGGVGSYSWQTESGGGGGGDGADWAAEQGEPGYIENKPVPKTLTGGTGISITESPSTITVSCNVTAPVQDVTVNGTSVVSNGVAAITMPTPPTVDQTYDGTSANPQSGVAVASGISDAVAALPTNLSSAQIQALKEALGIGETVLWEGTLSPSSGANCNVTFQVSESILNFERIEVFCNGSINYLTWHPVSGKTGTPVAYQGLNENTSNDVVIGGVIIVDNNTTLRYRCGYGSSFTTSYRGEYWGYGTPYKVVGVHRIANN